jgi:hypothetical protein
MTDQVKNKAPDPFRGNGACFSLEILFMMMVGDSPGPDVNLKNHTQILSEGQEFK